MHTIVCTEIFNFEMGKIRKFKPNTSLCRAPLEKLFYFPIYNLTFYSFFHLYNKCGGAYECYICRYSFVVNFYNILSFAGYCQIFKAQ